MAYISGKESRVEKEWNKRGIAGLRSSLLQKVQECKDFDDETTLEEITQLVFNTLPRREWDNARLYIEETLGLAGVAVGSDFYTTLMSVQLMEETLREDIGDE
jgi:hypothetical protein